MAMVQNELSDGDGRSDRIFYSRKKRREFKHNDALECIRRDYLSVDPLFG